MKSKDRNAPNQSGTRATHNGHQKRGASDRYVFVRVPEDSREPYHLQGPLDFDEYLEQIRRGGEDFGDEFVLRLIQHFMDAVYANEAPRPWVMRYIADQFYKVLHGGRWEDEFPLPWTKRSLPYSLAEWRALGMFCDVANAKRESPKQPITAVIQQVARQWSVSYETARAAYYKHRRHLSRMQTKDSE